MKNQYLGDIGDYGKYGLLSYLAGRGKKIGVNWYLTKCDPTVNHGNDRKYLEKDAEPDRVFDPDLYEAMKLLNPDNGETVARIKELGIIPGAVYFDDQLNTDDLPAKERRASRQAWHEEALAELEGAELIFADPDVGTINGKNAARKGAEHYALTCELAAYYDKGKDIVYYCHRARRGEAAWKAKKSELASFCKDSEVFVLTYRRGMQRSFIFTVHSDRADEYRALLESFLGTAWGTENGGSDHAPFICDPV